MTSRTAKLILALPFAIATTGCSMTLTGGGELGFGMRNDNFFVLKHTVDGDKEGKEAKSSVEIEKSILEAVLGDSDDPDSPGE